MQLCGFRKIYHRGTGVDCTECAEASKNFRDTKSTKKNTKVTTGGIKIVDGTQMTRPSGTDGLDLCFRSVKIRSIPVVCVLFVLLFNRPSSIKYAETSLNKIESLHQRPHKIHPPLLRET
jgi:hypothetical protein